LFLNKLLHRDLLLRFRYRRRTLLIRLLPLDHLLPLSLGVRLLRPLRLTRKLRLSPWTSIAELATAGTIAGATEPLWQVLRRDLVQQLLLVSAAEDMDLVDGDGVQEALDDAEDGAEAPGRVDQVQLAEALGVVVLGHGGGLADVRVDGGHLGDADALEVHDGAARLEELAGLARAGRQAWVGYLLVLDGEVLQHALSGRDLVHGGQVDVAHLLDIDWAAILWGRQLRTKAQG